MLFRLDKTHDGSFPCKSLPSIKYLVVIKTAGILTRIILICKWDLLSFESFFWKTESFAVFSCALITSEGLHSESFKQLLGQKPAPIKKPTSPSVFSFTLFIDDYLSLWRICGNRITSRMLGASASNMTKRSIPMPWPAVGGKPCSSAVTKSSS